jgi:hypothetical protein
MPQTGKQPLTCETLRDTPDPNHKKSYLQMRKLRLRGLKELAQDHRAFHKALKCQISSTAPMPALFRTQLQMKNNNYYNQISLNNKGWLYICQ